MLVHNSEQKKITFDEFGDIECSGVEPSYLPSQFEIAFVKENVSKSGHVVCILSRSFGLQKNYFVALKGSGEGMKFTVEVRRSYFVRCITIS